MYTPEEYRNILQMSSKKRVLVEGRDDYYLILCLFEELLGSDWNDVYGIEIEKAENYISAPGNRHAVENVANLVSKTNLESKFVGFVDREFREFDWENGVLDDRIKNHFIDGRVLWTRGHSVENYLLDEKILKIPFRDVSGKLFQNSFKIFKQNLESYLRVACKISIVAINLGYLNKLRASIKWDMIEKNGEINIDIWKIQLSKIGLKTREIENIVNAYFSIGDVVNITDIETIRWFCDGHLSFFFMWCAYARCVYEVTENPKDKKANAQRVLKPNDELRFNPCASAWAKSTLSNSCEYPKELLVLLNLNQSEERISS